MNQKQHHINRRLLPLVAALCTAGLLLASPAPAGPTTGELQQQIDELTAHVNRLRPLIEEPNDKSYFAGFAAISEIFQDCVMEDEGLDCAEKKAILIDVLEGQPVIMDFVVTGPTEGTTRFEIEKLPCENPLSSRDYQINVKTKKGGDVYYFNVSPADPIYASGQDSNYPGALLDLRCELVTDWRIKIISDSDIEVKQIRTESIGEIIDANIVPYTESARETELKVSIKNMGDFSTSYVVTATGFGPSIEPVAAESVFTNPDKKITYTLTFPIRTVDTFAGQGPCRVTLKSDRGKIWATTTADFPAPLPDPPPPEYIPDFDGDGDVDFGDYSYFGSYWLEQAGP